MTIGHRGLIRLTISVRGQAVHSGSKFPSLSLRLPSFLSRSLSPSPLPPLLVLTFVESYPSTSVHEWCTGEKGSNALMALCEALCDIEKFSWPLALYVRCSGERRGERERAGEREEKGERRRKRMRC